MHTLKTQLLSWILKIKMLFNQVFWIGQKIVFIVNVF